ncbi:MAG: alkaline phosphatase D family protein [Steroidobacteraceae bacterium]|jgi:alkaline phosphatase D
MSIVKDWSRRRAMALLGAATATGWLELLRAQTYPRILQGPMLGDTTSDSTIIWMRASDAHRIEVEYSLDPTMKGAARSVAVNASADQDYIVRIPLQGLAPATAYSYRVLLDGKPDRYARSPRVFRTLPTGNAPLRLAFGSCARRILDGRQPIFEAIAAAKPDGFFWVGDHVYIDSLAPMAFEYEYQLQRSVPSAQAMLGSVPQWAIWDDHDYGLNNGDRTSPVRELGLATFKKYWANPAYGLPEAPGVFFRKRMAQVECFFLDGRTYRDPSDQPDGSSKTQLGTVQKAWLKQALRESDATFKLLISGGGWATNGGDKFDESWGAYRHERDELFDFIRDESIAGVVLLSGDVHRGELNLVPRRTKGGYDLTELVSSPLAQPTRSADADLQAESRLRPPYDGGSNFGLLEFDADGGLALNLRDVQGRAVWEPVRLNARDLQIPRHRSVTKGS